MTVTDGAPRFCYTPGSRHAQRRRSHRDLYHTDRQPGEAAERAEVMRQLRGG